MGHAPSLGGLSLDGNPVLLGSTATHDPAVAARALWARAKPLNGAPKNTEMKGVAI
jgi:hypothetical protein